MNQETKKRIEEKNKGKTPDGYKKLAAGFFPSDWKEIKLFDICDIYSGGTPNTRVKEYWDGDIPWCVPTDITASPKYISKTEKCITKKGLGNSSATLMPPYSILMCSRATIGPRCINTVPMATNQGFKNLICKNKEDTEFVYYLLGQLVSGLLKKSNGSTFLELSKSELGNSTFAIPSSPLERKKIAQILMKWDEAIELQEQYIEKLKQYKAICLKKMFPAKGQSVPEWRFKGFSRPWEQCALSDISKVGTGFPFESKSFSDDGEYLVITNGNIQDSSSFVDVTIGNRISLSDSKILSNYVLDIGDILVTMDGTVGRTAMVLTHEKLILAQRVGRIKSKINAYFLFQWLNAGSFSKTMMELSHGGTIKHISLDEIRDFRSLVPSDSEEQNSIGSFLNSQDDHIIFQQLKVEELEKQRKALQDLLLTGAVRVK